MDCENILPHRQVPVASSLLEDTGLTWFITKRGEISDFGKFKELFKIAFRSKINKYEARLQLSELRQGKGSYDNYERKFDELVLHIGNSLGKEDKHFRFYDGLSDSLKKYVHKQKISENEFTLEKIKEIARFGNDLAKRNKASNNKSNQTGRKIFSDQADGSTNLSSQGNNNDPPAEPCPVCGERGHWARACPKRQPNRQHPNPPIAQNQPGNQRANTPLTSTAPSQTTASVHSVTFFPNEVQNWCLTVPDGQVNNSNSGNDRIAPEEFLMEGAIDCTPVRVLLDSGATTSFIDRKIADQLHLQIEPCDITIKLANLSVPELKACGSTCTRINIGKPLLYLY